MKKVLFLIGNLDSGGVSKSLVNLLSVIDRENYNITLWCGSPDGLYYPLLPSNINIISDKNVSLLLKGKAGLKDLLFKGQIFLFFVSILRLFLSLINKGYAGWLLSRCIPVINDVFDLIVDYNGQHQLYYMVDKLEAKKRVTFFHSDYKKWPYYYSVDKKYYPKVDAIFTISQSCVDSLSSFFPKEKYKIKIIENITSVSIINSLANQSIKDFENGITFLTVGHVCKNKGTDMAIKAASILKKNKIKFHWFFIGDIIEDFSGLIKEYGVDDVICFLGKKLNPYPYIKQATIYVHPSLFEGKSIALDEAKILCKPIVVTNFSTVHDQFENGYNALICEMNAESLAKSILYLIDNRDFSERLIKNLRNDVSDNTSEVEKIYALLK